MINLWPLQAILAASVPSQQERVITLIQACLLEHMTDGSAIVRAVSALGYNRRYVGIQLSTNAGPNADRSHWLKSGDGTYKLH